ncbi:MAG: 30S ribosome-binding factor RbfA [Chloroflexi bacterium]|nr:30S ribosome-binding factor RbfA [Chloroflexota bacterium]
MRRRLQRINAAFRQELSDLLLREVKDPRLTAMTSLTVVETSPDLRRARVYVSIMGNEEEKRSVLAGLRSATNFLRHELAERLKLRHVPELAFVLDESIERGARILSLIQEVAPSPDIPEEHR